MSEVLAIVSFMVALAAVWFTSEVLRRMEARTDPANNPYFKTLAAALEHRDRLLKGVEGRLKTLEGQVKAIEREDRPSPQILEREIAAIAAGLKEARRLRPASFPNG